MYKRFVSTHIHNEGLSLLLFLLSISLLATFQETQGLRDPSKAIIYKDKEFHINNVNNHNSSQEKRNVILVGATLIDGTTTPPKHNSIIVFDGNMITNVSDTTKYFSHSKNIAHLLNTTKNLVLNVTGKYVIPGLFDMHAHVAGVLKNSYNETKSKNYLKMFLINGVTTIRNPGGPTAESIELREKISSGELVGPKIFTAGRLINSPQIPIPFVEKQVHTE